MTTSPEPSQTAPSASQSDEAPLAGPVTPTTPRCALYARTSVGSPTGTGPQIAAMRDMAAESGFEIVTEFEDFATAQPGPAFQRMVDQAAERGYTHVVVYDAVALGRKAGPGREKLQALADAGLTLVTVQDGHATGPAMLRLTSGMMGAFAELDAQRINDVRRARRHQAAERQAREAQEAENALAEVEADWGPPDDDGAGRGERDQGAE